MPAPSATVSRKSRRVMSLPSQAHAPRRSLGIGLLRMKQFGCRSLSSSIKLVSIPHTGPAGNAGAGALVLMSVNRPRPRQVR